MISSKLEISLLATLVIAGVIARLVCLYIFRTEQVSDFLFVYEASADPELFKSSFEYVQKVQYLFFYSHLLRFWFELFGKSQFMAIILNIAAYSVTVIFLYLAAKKLFNSVTTALAAASLFALDPSMAIYTGVLSCEHFSIMFLSVFLYLMAVSHDATKTFRYKCVIMALAGVALVLHNMFKPVAFIFLIAYPLAEAVNLLRSENRTRKIKNIFLLTVMPALALYVIYFIGNNLSLHYYREASGNHRERAAMVSVYNGLAYDGKGVWSQTVKDTIAEVREKAGSTAEINQMLWNLLKSDFIEHKEEYPSIIWQKVKYSWDPGKSYIFWASEQRTESNNLIPTNNLRLAAENISCGYYLILSLLCIICAISCARTSNKYIFWLNIVVCGAFLLFLIIEAQGRYKSVFHLAFILSAGWGFHRISDCFQRRTTII